MIKSRTYNSMRNASFLVFSKLLQIFFVFAVRTLLIKKIGGDVLGLEGLFSSILSILNLAELGITEAIMVSLYKPLATDDHEKVSAIMTLFSKFYFFIGFAITIVGLALIPALPYLVNLPENALNVRLIYVLSLLTTSLSFFFSSRRILIQADQQIYKLSIIDTINMVLSQTVQLILIITTKNYILILVSRLVLQFACNIFIHFYARKGYPYLATYKRAKLDKVERKSLFGNAGAVMCHKLGSVMVTGTDNIIISAFISTLVTGMYGNYMLIISNIAMLCTLLLSSAIPSVGNLRAQSDDVEHHYQIFKAINMLAFIIIGFCSVMLLCLLNPFIQLWLGEEWLLEFPVVIVLVINFFISNSRYSINSFAAAAGYFKQTMVKPILEGIINLIISLVAVKYIGIIGVFVGTTASLILSFWVEPTIVYKKWFAKPRYLYFIDYFIKLAVIVIIATSVYYMTSLITISNLWLAFFAKAAVALVLSSIAIIATTCWTKEFKYLYSMTVGRIIAKIKHK